MTDCGKSTGITIHRNDECDITAEELKPLQALVAAYVEKVLTPEDK